MTQLYRVLYCSRNTIPGSAEQITRNIDQILEVSRRNNARQGVTGGLLYSEGCFAQVLEGPVQAVEQAFERIQCDERHSEVTVLQAGPIEARAFGAWSMAFTGTEMASSGPCGLSAAFESQGSAGDDVLAMLKAVVRRETEWLVPAEAAD